MSLRPLTVLVALVSTVVAVSAVPADADDGEAFAGTMAWVGCWRPISDEGGEADASALEQKLCIENRPDQRALALRAIAGDEVQSEEVLVVDGSRHPVAANECEGWRRIRLSGDGQRLYLNSETTCRGGRTTFLDSASLILSSERWVDISVSRVGDSRELLVRSFELLSSSVSGEDPPDQFVPLPWSPLPERNLTPEESSRVAATAPLDEDDVLEALATLDAAVVEAMLVQTGSRFAIDSDLLIMLADASVPNNVIDLMMALSYPQYFEIQDRTVERRDPPPSSVQSGWGPSPFYWWPYGYGYGYRYGDHHHHHDRHDRRNVPARAINGVGYTRVRPTGMPSGGVRFKVPGGTRRGGSGSGGSTPSVSSGGSASSSGYQGGGDSSSGSSGSSGGSGGSGRKAVPR